MDLNKCLEQAKTMASKAKPFILEHDGQTYTGVFDHNEWVYKVYENGFFMLNINMKNHTKAKQFLQQYLTN